MQEQSQSPDEATLRGGSDSSSEEFRASCEARYVLAKPLAQRRQYLEDVGRIRGPAGRATLEDAIRKEWAKKSPRKGG